MAAMEDVLDLYAEPYDPDRPVVCFDETSTQLLADTRPPIPVQPGQPRRQDYEYRRAGTRNIFLTCEPLAGWRHVAITERRTMEDFAHQMRWLVDEAYPDAPVVRVVLDNLNTHRMASLYETFPAAEARRIVRRLEFHHTPKHASWLNMAEIEFSVLTRACLQGAILMLPLCNGRSTPTRPSAMRHEPPSTGGSTPRTPEPNCIASIPSIPRLIEY